MYTTKEMSEIMLRGFGGGLFTGAFAGARIFVAFCIIAVVWVYTSLAWIEIGKKLRYEKSWLAWIPFARSAMILEMGGFHWALAFLWLVPVFGWIAIIILQTICSWKIYEKRKYPGWFALAAVLAFAGRDIGSLFSILDLIILGFVAWKDLKKPIFQ